MGWTKPLPDVPWFDIGIHTAVTMKGAINYCTCDTVDALMDNILHQLGLVKHYNWLDINYWCLTLSINTMCVCMYLYVYIYICRVTNICQYSRNNWTTPCKCDHHKLLGYIPWRCLGCSAALRYLLKSSPVLAVGFHVTPIWTWTYRCESKQ